ncbi:uncharacterized protein LOC111025368 [Momordica charantia]|uniref:Uncharacterized protein LOC111025368 n=1 Tax=Momordica charantia TaxID=3673 RepID=A0A6J1DXD9_MOMCH|nr:uncharacterized protein LOC111025368 [Momordica charantia]
MDSFSGLYIGLGSVLGLLFLGIAAELYYLLCWKKKRINSTELEDHHEFKDKSHETKQELDVEDAEDEDEGDLEVMGLYNLGGQPRFLFTINEETKEDLESEDGRSRNRSLGDIIMAIETPFFTPMASPPSLHGFGFNPLFESSPPPKFKFLRDAEEKLYRRLMEEAHRKPTFHCSTSSQVLPLVSSPPQFPTSNLS